jgi:hypothetical protein
MQGLVTRGAVMRRREFLGLLGGAAAWPVLARAQQPRATRTIGVFSGMSNEGQGKIYVKQLQQRLEELGWIEGRKAISSIAGRPETPENFKRRRRWSLRGPMSSSR